MLAEVFRIKYMLKRALFLFILLLITGCYEDSATVTIDGNNPPSFNLSGSGVPYFVVVGEYTGNAGKDWPSNVVWKIEPTKERISNGVWNLSPLRYGVVPEGYIQTYPKEGQVSALQERKIYYFSVPTYNAQGTGMTFIVKENKTIKVDK
jgi:hypothetical protein